MNYKNLIVCAFVAVGFFSPTGRVYAQEARTYSLQELLTIALEKNSQVVKSKLDYEEGKQKTREVKSAAMPQVNLNADLTDNVIQQAFVFPAALGDPNAGPDEFRVLRAGMQYSTSVTASATQQLFNKSVFTGIKAAKVSEDFYNQNIVRTEEEVIQTVATLFYQASSLDAQRKVLESTLEETRKNLKITTDRYEAGIARKLDVDRIKVSVTNLETQLRSVDDSYTNLINQLKLVTGFKVEAELEIEEPFGDNVSAYAIDPALTGGDWAFENKIEYRQLNTQLSLYDLERKNFSSGYFPTLSAFANYTYTGQSNDFVLSGKANSLWFDVASIGLRLNIPVFDGLNRSARMQQSRIRRIKTEEDMKLTREQSDMQYRNALKTYETSFASYEAQKENVALANSVYDVTLQNYNEGVSPLTDLLQAESSKIQAQSQLIESLLKVKQSEVALLKARGEIKKLLN